MASDVAAVFGNVQVSPSLKLVHDFFISCILGSRASSTMLRYDSHWTRFKSWCTSANISFLPAKPFHVAMYLSTVFLHACQNNQTFASIKAASAAISTAHDLANLANVTDNPAVNAVRNCASCTLNPRGE
jgi:hypothetical protein